MRLEVIVVAEARADYEIGFGLAGRVNSDVGELHDLHSRGIDAAEKFTVWNCVKNAVTVRGRNLRRFGLSREPFKGGDAETAWQVAALCSLNASAGNPPTIMLVRDTDNDSTRAEGLAQAVKRLRGQGLLILLAHPHPKREAWVLHGFDPKNAHEKGLLKAQCSQLEFDPRTQSHRLTAKGRTGKLNAKVVLDALTGRDREREDACWETAKLADLKKRGAHTGLASFLGELESWLQSYYSK